jgi:uridine kinase
MRTSSVFLIAIDGHGGSGKSTLADTLGQHYGAEILHTDDFASWENPVDWWPLLIERALKPIARGDRTLTYPRTQWWASGEAPVDAVQPVTPIMILEGVTALRVEFRPWISFGIFVETPAEICLQRGFERDRGMDGKSDAEIIDMWRKWMAAEALYMERDDPRGYANQIVDGSHSLAQQVPLLVQAIGDARTPVIAKTERG